jgi:histidyl-tRNA synthetase
LIEYLSDHLDRLDDDAKRRLHSNPLRILDTKNPAMQDVVNGAPQLMTYLGAESLAHFNGLRALLDGAGVAYTINPRLVRGMDYYNLSVFEFVTQDLGSQGTICAGGRYDGLIEQIGGKSAPAVGWALGVERLLELLKEQGLLPEQPVPDVYVVVPSAQAGRQAASICRALRTAGADVLMHAATAQGQGSMKAQFKRADGSGAAWAVILGDEELASGQVACKSLRVSQEQRMVKIADLATWWQEVRT